LKGGEAVGEEFKPDYYQLLEVSPFASQEEIESAYRRLVKEYHPDVLRAFKTAFLFRQLQEAYEVLRDPERRRRYDEWLRAKGLYPEKAFWANVLLSQRALRPLPEPQAWYVLFTIHAEKDHAIPPKPLNLCLVIDTSTSMKGPKLESALKASELVLRNLKEEDAFALVTFNDRATVILPLARRHDPRKASSLLRKVKAEGGTEMSYGISSGLAELLKAGNLWESINYMLLLTDGETYGDEEECVRLAREAGAKGISIAAVGLGTDWNEELLEAIAQASGGVSLYIPHHKELPKTFQERVGALMGAVSAFKGKLELGEGINLKGLFRLDPQVSRVTMEDGTFFLGPFSGSIRLLAELVIPPLPAGHYPALRWEFGDLKGELAARGEVYLTIAEGAEGERIPKEILAAAGQVAIFKLREKAWKEIRGGERGKASQRLLFLAKQLEKAGEKDLALLAKEEAKFLPATGDLSAEGRKRLYYGTRLLALKPPEEG
jgi:Ca-activated chloride channel family protein